MYNTRYGLDDPKRFSFAVQSPADMVLNNPNIGIAGLIPRTVMTPPIAPANTGKDDEGDDEEEDDTGNTQTKLEAAHDQTQPAGRFEGQGNFMPGGISDMDLNTKTPTLPPSIGTAQTTLATPSDDSQKGMLQRITDAVTSQANQFAAEQTGTEAKGSSTPMGRVLRAIAGVGTLAAVGGAPAVTAGAGVIGSVKDIMAQQAAANKAKESEDADEEDRQITNKLNLARIKQITEGGPKNDPVMKALQIRKAQLENQKLQDSIENGSNPSLANAPATEPKPDNPVTPAKPSYNGKDEPMVNKTNADFDATVVQPVLSSLRTKGVWQGLKNGNDVRQYFNANKDGLDIISKLNPSQTQALVESLVQIKQPGAMTPAQNADQLQANNPQTGILSQVAGNTIDALAAPSQDNFLRRLSLDRGPKY